MDDRSDPTRWGKFSDAAEAELPEYQVLSGLAVTAFLLGLFSSLAIVHVSLSFIGGAAVLCSGIALVRISSAPSEMSGRGLAVAGLVLAVFMTAAGFARQGMVYRLADLQSRKLAVQWFEFLKAGQPQMALELKNYGASRRPLDENLWKHYLSSESAYETMKEFVASPEVLALLTLGERADVRHYLCLDARSERAAQVFAVTYTDDGVKKSFLVQINLTRATFPEFGTSAWRTGATQAPWSPDKSS